MGTPSHEPPLIRRLVFAVLVLGVLAMHHLPAQHGPMRGHGHAEIGQAMPAAHQLPPADQVSYGAAADPAADEHSMLHLCLAVLLGAAGFLLVRFLLRLRRAAADRPSGGGRGEPGARAPPWRVGRGVLAAHCVLRI